MSVTRHVTVPNHPCRAFRLGVNIERVITGSWVIFTDVSQHTCGGYSNAPANVNDEVQYLFEHKKGNYIWHLLTETFNTAAIIEVRIDGAFQGSIDLYSLAGVYNVIKTLPISIREHGEHTLNIKVTGRNPASGGYLIPISAWWTTI